MIRLSFLAQVYELKTIRDGGFRVTFECGKDASEEIKELINHQGDMVQLACVDPDQPAAHPEESWEGISGQITDEITDG